MSKNQADYEAIGCLHPHRLYHQAVCGECRITEESTAFEVFLTAPLTSLTNQQQSTPYFFLRKEVIQPHLPIRLPCYDFTPVIGSTFGSSLLTVGSLTSGIHSSHGVTGGVYKTRERIHRDILIRDY